MDGRKERGKLVKRGKEERVNEVRGLRTVREEEEIVHGGLRA